MVLWYWVAFVGGTVGGKLRVTVGSEPRLCICLGRARPSCEVRAVAQMRPQRSSALAERRRETSLQFDF